MTDGGVYLEEGPAHSSRMPCALWQDYVPLGASTPTLSHEEHGLEGFWAPLNTDNRKIQQMTSFLKKKKNDL